MKRFVLLLNGELGIRVLKYMITQDQIENIAHIQLEHLEQRLLQQDMHLKLTPESINFLAEAGYDPVYGARPLKRVIQQKLENPLAQALLTGKFKPGDTIEVEEEGCSAIVKATGTRCCRRVVDGERCGNHRIRKAES